MSMISILMAVALSAPVPSSNLVIQPCEFDEAYQFTRVDCQIEVHNIGTKPIRLHDFEAVGEGKIEAGDGLTVAPNGIAHLPASVQVRNEEGRSRFYFRFRTDEPGHEKRNAEVRGFVANVLDQVNPVVDFGVVKAEDLPASRSIALSSLEIPDFRIERVLQSPSYVEASIKGDGRTLDVRLKPSAPLGPNERDFIKVGLKSPRQTEAWIRLKSNVHGDILPSSNPFAMGLMRTGQNNEFLIRLTSRSGKDFKIESTRVDKISATVSEEACMPAETGCRMLKLRIGSDQATGQLGGTVNVRFSGQQQTLPIFVWGMLLSPEVKVVDLDKEFEKSQAEKGMSTPVAKPLDIRNALKMATTKAPVDLTPPPGTGPLLKWSAANEQLVHGYAIYRASEQGGAYVRVSERTIFATGVDAESPSSYQWRDATAQSGKTYWYYIGAINKDGTKEPLSSPQKVTAK